MSSRTRPALLFDVMSTLVYDPFHVDMPAFFGMTLDELMAAKHPTAWLEFENGVWTEEAFLTRFFRDGRAYDHAGFVAATFSRYAWLDGMEELLGALHADGHDLHLFSNYPRWYREIERRLGLSRFASWTFVSCELGVRKPAAAAYRIAASAARRSPADCLLVDDTAVNCAAARAGGMDAIDFAGVGGLRRALADRGLL